ATSLFGRLRGRRVGEVGATAPSRVATRGGASFWSRINRLSVTSVLPRGELRRTTLPQSCGLFIAAVPVDCLSIRVQIANSVVAKPQQKLRKERLLPAARSRKSARAASMVGKAGGSAR